MLSSVILYILSKTDFDMLIFRFVILIETSTNYKIYLNLLESFKFKIQVLLTFNSDLIVIIQKLLVVL